MTEKEYRAIIKAIEAESRRTGSHTSDVNARAVAKNLLPAVRVMAAYGLHYSKTRDIVRLKSLMGHASINVTDIYL